MMTKRADERAVCNCENLACKHQAGECGNKADSTKRLMYIGAVCQACWDRCDSRYRLTRENKR